MGLLATIACIIFSVLSYITNNTETRDMAINYSIFFMGISLICFAIEKNKTN